MKYVKYMMLTIATRIPVILGVLVLLYVWCIQEPYVSELYNYNASVICENCSVTFGSKSNVCSKCGSDISDTGEVLRYRSCDKCKKVYRNSKDNFCNDCGEELTLSEYVKLTYIGYDNVSDFRREKIKENIMCLLNNKILATIIALFAVKVCNDWIKIILKRAITRKIIKEDLQKNKEW